MAKIQLEGLHKSYDGVKILNNISLTVEEGEFMALLGTSGSGKTTILHAIAGTNELDDGIIKINNQEITNIPVNKRHVVLVDQNLLLFPHMTVKANIGFGLRMQKVERSLIKKKAEELIDLLALKGHENKYPHQLSGGQMQRVAIARALATEPYVLLLDEPFSKLDISLRNSMQKLVSNLQKKLGMTTILVTHDKDEALSMADRVAILSHGKIIQVGEPYDVYEHPKSIVVSRYFGDRNYFDGSMLDGKFTCSHGVFLVDSSKEGLLTMIIRPEEITISLNRKGVLVTIESTFYKGDVYTYVGKKNNNDIFFYGREQERYKVGDEIWLNIPFKQGVLVERSKHEKNI